MTIRDIPSPQPSSREKHHHTIKAPSVGEGADRGEIKNLCSIQDKIVFKKTSGTLPSYTSKKGKPEVYPLALLYPSEHPVPMSFP
jgi:hypothetical protein